MELYNKDGKEVILPQNKVIIGRGCYADVYSISPTECVKIFTKYDCPADSILMENLKNLKLHHFDSLKEILYDKYGSIKAYIMNRFYKELPDFYIMKPDELIRHYVSLYRDILELTDKGVYLSDLKPANTMVYKGVLKIIDYDFFEYSKSPKLAYYNNESFLRLWMQLLQVGIIRNNYRNILFVDTVMPLFDYNLEEKDVSHKLDELKEYKLVIDYFMERQNGKRK